jgi:hypothetical protein
MRYFFYTIFFAIFICGFTSNEIINTSFKSVSSKDTIKVTSLWRHFPSYDRYETKLLMSKFSIPNEAGSDTSNVFAYPLFKFKTKNTICYAIAWSDSIMAWGSVTYLYVFSKKSKMELYRTRLAYGYGSEGSDIEEASWIYDYDRDRNPEIINHSYSLFKTGDTENCSDSIVIQKVDDGKPIKLKSEEQARLKKLLLLKGKAGC